MTPLRLLSFTLIVVVVSTLTARCFATDTHNAFLQGLRERGYFDIALQYLDSLSSDDSTPNNVRATLGLERAAIWMERSETARHSDDRENFLGQGLAAFELFLNDYPEHPRAAWTHAQLGQVLFDRALHKLRIRDAPANTIQRDELTDAGRQLLERAGESFGRARDLHKKQLAEIPFVNQEEDEQGYQLRRRTEDRHEQAWLSVVKCGYQMAMTRDPDDGRRTELLEQVAEQCEVIHARNRRGVGQDARLMIGKCRLALGDISQAIGYFDELRKQPAQDSHTLRLSHTAQYYRLVCLNHKSRQEFRNVIAEATRWLKQHPAANNTTAGLGIRHEKAIASEALTRSSGLTDEQRQLRLRQTLTDMEIVGALSNPLQESARFTARRLRDELGQDRREPKNFDTAFDRGREIIGRLQEARSAVKLAETGNRRTQAAQELELLEAEAGRMFDLALKLRDRNSDRSAVAQARYLLSYVLLRQNKSYHAFVLSRHVIRHHSGDAKETAANASEMAISAARHILSAADENDRMFELNLVREICEEVLQRFPRSRHATNARMQLGRTYLDLDEPQQAAEAFLQIPQDDTGYATARIAAGRAWHRAWAQASDTGPTHSPDSTDPTTLADWKQRARTLLTEGIRLSRVAQSDNRLTDEIVQAEVSLCGLMNTDGDFAETVRHLAHGNPTVLGAVESPGERPQNGIKSTAFAALCYRILLRAYVGAQQVDDALVMMQKLQDLGANNTTSIYTQLGRELQEELERLQDSGQHNRLQQVRMSFEQFLEEVYSSRDHSNTGALLWIAETYSDIASDTDDPGAAKQSFSKAGTIYRELLNSELDDTLMTRIKLRLIQIYRQQKNFPAAVELGTEVLTKNPASVSVQLEVAHVLADWGENGEPARLLESIRGIPADQNPKTIWGWAALSRRLQRSRRQQSWKELKPLFLESRFELSQSRLRYARTVPDKGRQQLEAAAQEIVSMIQVSSDLSDEWWSRFDGLYQEIQARLGQPGLTLARPDIASVPGLDGADANPSATAAARDSDNSSVVQKGSNFVKKSARHNRTSDVVLFGLGIGFMVAVAGTVSFVIVRRPKKRVRYNYDSAATSVQFATVTANTSSATGNPVRAVSSRKTKTRTSSKSKQAPGKPASRSKLSETPRSPGRRRPRPPNEE